MKCAIHTLIGVISICLSHSVSAGLLPVSNPSFEIPDIPTVNGSGSLVGTGWESSNPASGVYYPAVAHYTSSIVDGDQVLWINRAIDNTSAVYQKVGTHEVQDGQTYDLSVRVLRRILHNQPGLTVGLYDTNVDDDPTEFYSYVETTLTNNSVLEGGFVDISLSFTADASDHGKGLWIKFELTEIGTVGTPGSPYNNQVNLDNVQLISAVPIPAAAWLLGSGLLGLIGMGRRKARS